MLWLGIKGPTLAINRKINYNPSFGLDPHPSEPKNLSKNITIPVDSNSSEYSTKTFS